MNFIKKCKKEPDFSIFNSKEFYIFASSKTESVEGDFLIISDPISTKEKEIIELAFAKITDEKVPLKKSQMSIKKNSFESQG